MKQVDIWDRDAEEAVAGSNMAGQSTLLRALGMNVVPARAGAPVCARSMHIRALRVDTSMRVEEDLDGERDDVDGVAGLDDSRCPP